MSDHVKNMGDAVAHGWFKDAALAALAYAEEKPGWATIYTARAQVYATLHQAEMALFIAEHRQPVVPQ